MIRISSSSEIDFTFLSTGLRGLAGAQLQLYFLLAGCAATRRKAKPPTRRQARRGARGMDESLDDHKHLLLSGLNDDNG
ncbi:uncharacterized protein PgNI_09772 [Pyricularia grisea]|uniref:Uncharacterized protein n=1 Tax=Pyricularia grisea TaxID=148305 RepID=A0A6P8ATA7_PYRGI|nr:uncharacterized protein PgNI_09772 [Pyricularia grisea]TLD05369.1 hypothetical protein PgNI_09772 [Pyricularia grisea]